MKSFKTTMIACALGSSVLSAPSFAQCWDGKQLAAARVRDLQTMLMAETLRCHAVGQDISDHYNGFVNARRGELDGANATLKGHFTNTGGATAYDHFTTALANAYGQGETTPAACDEAAQTADDAANSVKTFLEIAEQRSAPSSLDACARTETIAAATPADAAPSDAEVAAALAVLNRYRVARGGDGAQIAAR